MQKVTYWGKRKRDAIYDCYCNKCVPNIDTTLGRYLRRKHNKILKKNKITDKDLDKFVSKIVTKMSDISASFLVLTGKKILKAYKKRFGKSSCMTGEHCQFVQLYADNPDKIGLLTLKYGKLHSRALIWNTDEGEIYVDNIYGGGQLALTLFKKYVKSNGYIEKSLRKKLSVTLKKPSNELYPYTDTFRYLIFNDDDTIILYNYRPNNCYYVLESINGNILEIEI